MARKRRSRYERKPEPEPVQESPRVARICRDVWRHRFLSSAEIADLDGGSPANVGRKLKTLFDNEYLDMPKAQRSIHVPGGGSNPDIYGLDLRGAVLVRERYGIPVRHGGWKEKNRDFKPQNFHHERGVASFMVRLALECRARGDLELVYLDEILAALVPQQRNRPNPHRWPVTVKWRGKSKDLNPTPDGIFCLRYGLEAGERRCAYFFFEYDRGTETNESDWIERSTVLKKFYEYAHTHEQALHTKFYGAPNFRVLFVTKSKTRVDNLIKKYWEHKLDRLCPGGAFLFADEEALAQHDILTLPWINARRERRSLAPDPAGGGGFPRR